MSRMLWKAGFEVPRHSETYARLRVRLNRFREAVLSMKTIRRESDREAIRSAGVNFFVSVEEVLQALVAFNLWVLVSDHLVATHWQYDSVIAVAGVTKVLPTEIQMNGTRVRWATTGSNALGTVLAYLSALASWMEDAGSGRLERTVRPSDDLPHYADDPEMMFSLRHVALWMD